MGGLLEEPREKSTREIEREVSANLKQHPFHPVPNQNEAESKRFTSNRSSSSNASNSVFPSRAKMLIRSSFVTKVAAQPSLVPNSHSLPSSLALRLLLGGHAPPLA